MGYRAHQITQVREYGNTLFSDWTKFFNYWSNLREYYGSDFNDAYVNESEDYFEIPVDIVKKEIHRLGTLKLDELDSPHAFIEDTNEGVLYTWQMALEDNPKDASELAIEWF